MKITKAQLKRIIKEELEATMDEGHGGGYLMGDEEASPEPPEHKEHATHYAEILAPKIMNMIYNKFWIDDTEEGEEEMFQAAIKQLILDWYTGTGAMSGKKGAYHPEYKAYMSNRRPPDEEV